MSSFAIPPCSSLSISNLHQHSRLCFIVRNRRSNFEPRRTCLRCSKGTGGTGSGEKENRSVLDAFFLGKALAEVINERIESSVGEVLGTIGRFQAEQQKQVEEIQEEVLERAKKSKERAARETMEAQGLVASKPPTINPKPALNNENLSAFSGSSTFTDDDSV